MPFSSLIIIIKKRLKHMGYLKIIWYIHYLNTWREHQEFIKFLLIGPSSSVIILEIILGKSTLKHGLKNIRMVINLSLIEWSLQELIMKVWKIGFSDRNNNKRMKEKGKNKRKCKLKQHRKNTNRNRKIFKKLNRMLKIMKKLRSWGRKLHRP